MPMSGVIAQTFSNEAPIANSLVGFFSVAKTTPSVAIIMLVFITQKQKTLPKGIHRLYYFRTHDYVVPLIPTDVTPALTAFKAYSI